jgi:hypothetical protein
MRSLLRSLLAALALTLVAAPAAAQQPAFRTDGAATVTLAATTTSGRVQIRAAATGTQNIRVYNAGTVAAFIECGTTTVDATVAASMPIAPGTVEVIGCNQTHLAGITGTGTATLYVTPGTGL